MAFAWELAHDALKPLAAPLLDQAPADPCLAVKDGAANSNWALR
jgi:hypothetical protein